MLRVNRITLLVAIIASLAPPIRGVCTIPQFWRKQLADPNLDQLWAYKPDTVDGLSWQLYMFTETLMIDTSSNTQYECVDSSTDPPTGITKVLYKKISTGTNMCLYGRLASDQNTNKVLLYKRSVESTTNPPQTLTDCEQQTGIDSDVFNIMIRVPLNDWTYSNTFDTIPDGTYLFSVQKDDQPVECQNDPQSTFTKNGISITVNSPCIDATTANVYGNPFAEPLKITDSITGDKLGLGTSQDAGFVIFNSEKVDGTTTKANKFYVAKYETVNGIFTMSFESNVPDLMAKGYWMKSLIPSDRQPVSVTLQSQLCLTGTYCTNGGTCVPGFTTASCVCPEFYEGDRCQSLVDRCNPNPCLNGGFCQQTGTEYTCSCSIGWTGINCEMKDKCLTTSCQNGGTCYTYKDANQVDQAYCDCVVPYTGDMCGMINPCLTDPCQNGGTCLTQNEAKSSTDYLCQCPAGTYGNSCEFTGVGPCASTQCLNGGTCEVVGDSFVCRCPPTYTGNTCEVPLGCTPITCKNEGTCVPVGNTFYCDCTSYYSGAYCEEYEDWFIILLVLIILAAIIFFILTTVCACYCCCGWRPGSNKTPYEAYMDQQQPTMTSYPDQTSYMSSYAPPAEPAADTVQFNFVPLSQYQGISTMT